MKTFVRLLPLSVLFLFLSCNVENLDNPQLSLDKSTKGEPDNCETAFGYFEEGCFIDDEDYEFNRWGWVIGPLSDASSGTYDIYAGAGKCDITKGELVGSLTINYEGGTATVDYDANSGYGFFETHLYVGNDKYPTNPKGKPTVAPGQYGNQNYFELGSSSDSYTIDGLEGEIYVIAHAVVCPFKDVCEAEAGTINADKPDVCLENGLASISATPVGDAVVPDGYEVLYVLTLSSDLLIVDVSDTPSFTVDDVGDYRIHTLVYDPNTLDLSGVVLGETYATEIYALLIDGGGSICAALDVDGAIIKVVKCT